MRPLFLFKSEKKTDEGHLKQMRDGLRNNLLFYLALSSILSREVILMHLFSIIQCYELLLKVYSLEINKSN